MQYAQPAFDGMLIKNPDNWNHKAGNACFTRVLNTPVTDATKIGA
jgi:hypothetical protein